MEIENKKNEFLMSNSFYNFIKDFDETQNFDKLRVFKYSEKPVEF